MALSQPDPATGAAVSQRVEASAPAVSVIVPFLGANKARLGRLLSSLMTQRYDGIVQIILVDNNSDAVLAESDLPVRGTLLHEPEPGSYVARNAGLALANGEVVAFTDSDCVASPDWLTAGVRALLADPVVGVVGGGVEALTRAPGAPTLTERYDAFFHMRQAHYVAHMGFAATANLFVRRDLVRQLGGFDTRFRSGGDREFCRRVREAGHALRYAPDALVRHDARQLGGLLLKSRRLAGQEWSRATASGAGLRRAVRSDLRIWSLRVRRLLDAREPITMTDRFAFGALSVVLETVRVAELVRIRVTGASPERR
jgi:GT2 family glycosyltransferase